MQKIGKKASILLWSVFLSMTLVIAFVSINYQVTKNLQQNSQIIKKIEENNEKKKAIGMALLDNDLKDILMPNGERIVFEQDNIIKIGLKKNEELKLSMSGGVSSNITIKILEGAPISYKNSKIQGDVNDTATFNTNSSNIDIKNLGGYSLIQITSENKFEKIGKKYRIIREYPSRVIQKEKGEFLY